MQMMVFTVELSANHVRNQNGNKIFDARGLTYITHVIPKKIMTGLSYVTELEKSVISAFNDVYICVNISVYICVNHTNQSYNVLKF